MATKERTVGVVCPRCSTTQPVPVAAVAHECPRCNWDWRFAICATCDTVACSLEYLESWRCESCNTFNRSWWKTADAEREAALVAERRRIDNATHPGRRLAIVGLIVAFVLGSVWYVMPRQTSEEREAASALTACRRFDQVRRDEASGTLTRGDLLRQIDALDADATGAPAEVRTAVKRLAAAARSGTDRPAFPAAMTAVGDACRSAAASG